VEKLVNHQKAMLLRRARNIRNPATRAQMRAVHHILMALAPLSLICHNILKRMPYPVGAVLLIIRYRESLRYE
jgi:hypothetical protein